MVKSIEIDSPSASHLPQFAQPANQLQEEAVKVNTDIKPVSPTTEVDEKTVKIKDLVEVKEKQALQEKKDKAKEEKELENAIEVVSDFMKLYNRNVNFSLDEGSDKTIIKVFDSDSKELIKQFPSEDLLELARKIYDVRQDIDLKSGIFLDEKV